MTLNNFKKPWRDLMSDGWLIVGMNHYKVSGVVFLFVAMAKDGKLIKEEGPDDVYLWNRLWHQAEQVR